MSEITPESGVSTHSPRWSSYVRNTAFVLLALLIFLFGLELMLSTLQHLGKPAAEAIILATSNPFTALFIGLLITAIIQSSTATTSMTVALVASGSLTLESAVPIVMGANIGTTITSTIVSLGFLPRKKEFRRAVAAGTYHDFFNILTVVILFPLEYYFHFLSSLSRSLATVFFHQPWLSARGFAHLGLGLGTITDALVNLIGNGFVLIVLSLVILFGSILFFRKVLTSQLGLGSSDRFQKFFFQRPLKSFAWGVLTTAAIRSSSVTTSLVVPLVAKKVVKLRSAVPFILGANLGTTFSALLAALMNSQTAISIALAHVLFNLIGVLLFGLTPYIREVPVQLAQRLGRLTLRYRLAGLLYLLLSFFFIPFSLIYFNRDAVAVTELTYQRIENNQRSFFTVIAKTFENQSVSTRSVYPDKDQDEPSQIYSVYRKNNVLIINNELFEMNKPGFCRDGEDAQGKFRMCIREIIPSLATNPGQTFASVFVFEKTHDADPAQSTWYYIGSEDNLVVRRERRLSGQTVLVEELMTAERK
jgi:sodium-dependent phosphate cotransporter